MDLRAIEAYLHRQIPITAAMGVRIASCDAERLVLTAPLKQNHNHLGTAFGGSLAAIATLAGYCVIWLELGEGNGHVVIRDSRMNFRRPVTGAITAVCRRLRGDQLAEFRDEFQDTGRARLVLKVIVEEGGEAAVEFEGTFVAIR